MPMEFLELVTGEMVKMLVRLMVACRQIKVPQKWIGSSVVLGFDDSQCTPRG